MGFRKHRRHRGGGGGGGGGHHHHYSYGTGEANGVQPGDDIGNRRQMKPVHVPPDDLGNRKDPEEAEWVPEDSVGNRIEASPTHELSGVLLELDGRRRRRRPKGVSAPERVGRYLVGGVNPLIAANVPRPFPGKTLEESLGGPPARGGDEGRAPFEYEGQAANDEPPADGGRRERAGRRERGDGGPEVHERRTQRFFDFEEDDRFEYTLKTPAEQKRADAEACVRDIVVQAGREATVLAKLIEDGTRPKVLVTVEERGPASSLAAERRSASAAEPLFVMGNGALMSLNYLVNKIVNRYPDDRIRLAILPAADERLYVDSLAEHRKLKPLTAAGARAPAPAAPGVEPTSAPAAAPVTARVAAPALGSVAAPLEAPTVVAEAAPVLVLAAAPAVAPVALAVEREAAPTTVAAAPSPSGVSRRARSAGLAEPAPPPVDEPAGEDAAAEKPKAPRKARAPREELEAAPKRPLRRPVKKTPAVEVVRAPRGK